MVWHSERPATRGGRFLGFCCSRGLPYQNESPRCAFIWQVLYSTVVWLYTWPKSSPEGHAGVEKAARDVSERELALEEKYQKLLERVEALEELDAAHEH